MSPYASEQPLQNRLLTELDPRHGVAVALYRDGTSELAANSSFSPEEAVLVGCIAKCLTATLFAMSMKDAALTLEDPIADALGIRSPGQRRALAGVTTERLLNHTHGLDDADVQTDEVPRRPDATIDVEALCATVTGTPRLARAGSVYSYGGVGSWLVAGLLERRFGCSYLELLERTVFAAAGIDAKGRYRPEDVCPAWGGRLELSVLELYRFLLLHVSDPVADDVAVLRRGEAPMPGWVPWQRAATCCWNLYGDDWFGHNGNRDGTGIALRFHRGMRVALAVASPREADCFVALPTLFGEVLEEYAPDYVDYPRPLDAAAWAGVDAARFVGRYDNARWRVEVGESRRPGFLRMRVFDRRGPMAEAVLERYLRLAQGDVCLVTPPGNDYPFVQFLGGNGAAGHAEYFWNGRQLWRSAGSPAPTSGPGLRGGARGTKRD